MELRDGTIIGNQRPPYFIAEVNSSHNGSVDTARRMIEAAADSGCDCVKFQSWSAETLYSKTYYDKNPIASRFVKKFSLDESQLLEMADHCRKCGIGFSSTPYSTQEVDFLVRAEAPFIKIASMELNNLRFLAYIAKTGMPIVLSTGMGDYEEICKAVDVIESAGNSNICLLHCISIYPAKPETINLRNITMLHDRFPNYEIGFSDHSIGTELAAAATALGASVIEKHLTLDRTKVGMDNQMATEPEEISKMVAQCTNVALAMGSYDRIVSDAEYEQRKNMRRSLIYLRDMRAGEVITEQDISCKRPGTGFPPTALPDVIGKRLANDVEADTVILHDDLVGW